MIQEIKIKIHLRMQITDNGKLIASSIIVAALIIAGSMVYTPGSGGTDNFLKKADGGRKISLEAAMSTDDDFVLGNPDAPVTMVVFGDYECPFCKKSADTAEAQVREEYVASGKVKVVFRDYPLSFHEFARPAAIAAQCAGAQGKYWEYHDMLFKNQEKLASVDFAKLAGEVGIDSVAFTACTVDPKTAAEVEADFQAGQLLGVEGTPATFINGALIPGAYPYETYKEAIETALKEAE